MKDPLPQKLYKANYGPMAAVNLQDGMKKKNDLKKKIKEYVEEVLMDNLKEMTTSAAAGGQEGGTIKTPNWVSKSKEGSVGATLMSKKLGFKPVKSIAEGKSMKIILLKSLLEQADPMAAEPAPQAPPTAPVAPPAPAQPAAAPAASYNLAADFAKFKNEIKSIDSQKTNIVNKYQNAIKKNLSGKEISVFASKAQYFQPASNYKINVSDVKIDSHYDKTVGSVVYDLILIDDDKKYYLKNLEAKSTEAQPTSSEAPPEQTPPPAEKPAPEEKPAAAPAPEKPAEQPARAAEPAAEEPPPAEKPVEPAPKKKQLPIKEWTVPTQDPPEPLDSVDDFESDIESEVDDILVDINPEDPDPKKYKLIQNIAHSIYNKLNTGKVSNSHKKMYLNILAKLKPLL
jgi:hypothetical protein